jgi:hypothetical protein
LPSFSSFHPNPPYLRTTLVLLLSGNPSFFGVHWLTDHGAITNLATVGNPAYCGYKTAGQRRVLSDNGKITAAISMSPENVGNVTLARIAPAGVRRAPIRVTSFVAALPY